MMRKEFKLVS